MKLDLTKFKDSVPYASEMFGVYQPLLGWKSQRIRRRFSFGIKGSRLAAVDAIAARLRPDAHLHVTDFTNDDVFFEIDKLNMAAQRSPNRATPPMTAGSTLAELIAKAIVDSGMSRDDKKGWKKLLNATTMAEMLADVIPLIAAKRVQIVTSALTPQEISQRFDFAQNAERVTAILNERLARESVAAGLFNALFEGKRFDLLEQLFFPDANAVDLAWLDEISEFIDPMENFNPSTDIGSVSLSPVGIVHLFRQYFFEFDTFLGAPAQHIWLSPGSTLELIEIHSRRHLIERTVESSIETIIKSEKSTTDQDELSRAVKDENQGNTKFGISVNAGGSVTGGVAGVYSATGHADTTTSYGLESNQKTAKEVTHKQMRQQSDKLSSEIKQNFKTTFKTVTEVQDTASKRYVLQNTTANLVNYELRRKMRQVGVQVQDVGTQLCWQTYVDLPGSDLGLGNLVHIGEPPEMAGLPHPEQPALPEPITKDYTRKIYFQGWTGDNDTNQTYIEHGPLSDDGWAVSDGSGNDRIHVNYLNNQVEEVPGYELKQVVFDSCIEGKLVEPEFFGLSVTQFGIHLKKVNFDGDAITLKLKLVYVPTAVSVANMKAKYDADLKNYDSAKAQLAKEAFVKSARERIKLASNIQPRKFEDLREEERTIVYRHLIGSLLNVGVPLTNATTRHVMAELINSMFDVDQMLYFVAPEWWMPREHHLSRQNVGGAPGEIFKSDDVVSWGGAGANYRPNYFITEDSTPARLGSSLGWLLQLDADNFRNAFLNAPWVKAVIPIRAGKELAALNWLMQAHVEGTDGIDARYQEGSEGELDDMVEFLEAYPWQEGDRKTRYTGFASKIAADPLNVFVSIRDALNYLALRIKLKDQASKNVKTETVDGKTISYLPTEKVYEHGFDPLTGGFKAATTEPFAIFDQWIEVLPTDQVAAVEVKYDPKTGLQV